jgi:uncharacterized protein
MRRGFQKILNFFITKIFIGLVLIAGLVVLVETIGNSLQVAGNATGGIRDIAVAFLVSTIALLAYKFLYRYYEKRPITELSFSSLGHGALAGFVTGLLLQSLFILVIYISGHYLINHINPVSALLPAFTTSVTAGFVAEIMIVGIFYRLVEEKSGTAIALGIITILFAIFHINAKGATFLSIVTTGVEAGLLPAAAYVYYRNLWFPIFMHFAWDFAEPGIFGGINPGNNPGQSLFSSQFTGPDFLTGGPTGPQNSLQALIISLAAGLIFLWLAERKNNFLNPEWIK